MGVIRCKGTDLLAWRRELIRHGGRAVDLDWLLSMAADCSWGDLQKLRICPDVEIELSSSLHQLTDLWVQHRDQHIPLQHLVGICPWRDLELEVSSAALIPRQETELLIDFALQCLPEDAPDMKGVWADLGTGSGALAAALARVFPRWQGHGVDSSGSALALAKRNLISLAGESCWQLHLGSWWEPLKPWWGQLDLVLSNPPYIPTAVMEELEPVVKDHEPHLALCGGDDGLDCCRQIIRDASRALAPGGWILLEHHHDQSAMVLKLLSDAGLERPEARYDLQGIPRFALAQRSCDSIVSNQQRDER
jgi:release factor glutamine methyltransferase